MKRIGFVLLVVVMLSVIIGCSGEAGKVSSPSISEQPQAAATSIVPSDDVTNEQPEPSSSAAPTSIPSESALGKGTGEEDTSKSGKDKGAGEEDTSKSAQDKGVDKEDASELDKGAGEAESSQPPVSSPKPSIKPEAEPSPVTPVTDTITIMILGNADWGTVLAEEKIKLSEGDTPADALIRAAKAHRLSYDIRGSGAMTYIEGIDGLYEFDDGPTSGWKFRVNGIVAGIGAGSYELKPGDRLEWFYSYEDSEAEEDKESKS